MLSVRVEVVRYNPITLHYKYNQKVKKMKKIETFKEFLMEKEDRETEYFFYPNGVYISTKLSEITEDKIREYKKNILRDKK